MGVLGVVVALDALLPTLPRELRGDDPRPHSLWESIL